MEIRRLSLIILVIVSITSLFIIKRDLNLKEYKRKTIKRDFLITGVKESKFNKKLISKNFIIETNLQCDFKPLDKIKVQGELKKVLENTNLGYGLYLKSKGIDYILKAKKIELLDSTYDKSIYVKFILKRHEKINALSNKINFLYKKRAGFVKALILGNRSELSKDDLKDFSNCLVSHIISISGFHILLISNIFLSIFFFLPKITRYTLSLGLTFIYILLIGIRPSCLRAYMFLLFYFISVLIHRRYDVYSISFLIISVYLVLNPYKIFDSSFVLSFLAVISIAMFYKIINDYLLGIAKKKINYKKTYTFKDNFRFFQSEILKYFIPLFSITISANILTIPYVYYKFNVISVVGVFVNLIVVPIIGLIFPFLITSLIFFKFYFVRKICANIVNFLINIFFIVVRKCSNFKFSHFEIENPSIKYTVIFYVIIVVGYNFYQIKRINKNTVYVKE